MRRHPLNVLPIVSLLLCLAVVALWVRSYVVHDWVCAARGGRAVYVHSSAGSITVVSDAGTAGPATAVHWFADRDPMPAGGTRLAALVHFHAGTLPGLRITLVRFPHWAAAVVAAAWPLARLVRRRRTPAGGFPVDPPRVVE